MQRESRIALIWWTPFPILDAVGRLQIVVGVRWWRILKCLADKLCVNNAQSELFNIPFCYKYFYSRIIAYCRDFVSSNELVQSFSHSFCQFPFTIVKLHRARVLICEVVTSMCTSFFFYCEPHTFILRCAIRVCGNCRLLPLSWRLMMVSGKRAAE